MVNTDSFVNTLKGLGTLQWASPEVLLGTHPVSPHRLLVKQPSDSDSKRFLPSFLPLASFLSHKGYLSRATFQGSKRAY